MSAIEVSGNPSEEELAAVVAVLTATTSGGAAESDDPGPRSAWGSHARQVGQAPHPGPGAWRASALPG